MSDTELDKFLAHHGVEASVVEDASEEDLENFLTHYGVKGMKWGVRRSEAELARSRGARKDRVASKVKKNSAGIADLVYDEVDKTEVPVARFTKKTSQEVANTLAEETSNLHAKVIKEFKDNTNEKQRALNEEFAGIFARVNAGNDPFARGKAQMSYNKKYAKILDDFVSENTPEGYSARTLIYHDRPDMYVVLGGSKAVKKLAKQMPGLLVKHADEDLEPVGVLRIKPTRDKDGLITSIEVEDATEADLEHSDDIDNFLAHYGVKGMKWGVRKDRSKSGGGVLGRKKQSTPEYHKDSKRAESFASEDANPTDDAAPVHESDTFFGEGFTNGDVNYSKYYSSVGDAHYTKYSNGEKSVSFGNDDTFIDIGKDGKALPVGGELEAYKTVKHSEEDDIDNFLAHYGVKGMKWGVRRSDAELDRAAGRDGGSAGTKKRAKGLKGVVEARRERKEEKARETLEKAARRVASTTPEISADAERFVKTSMKAGSSMSDQEIKKYLERARLVKEYEQLTSKPTKSQAELLKEQYEVMNYTKKMSDLRREMTPKKASKVDKFVKRAGQAYAAYTVVDKATGGELSKKLGGDLMDMINGTGKQTQTNRPAPKRNKPKGGKRKKSNDTVYNITSLGR